MRKINIKKHMLVIVVFAIILSACAPSDMQPTPAPTAAPTPIIDAPYQQNLSLLWMPRRAQNETIALSNDDLTVKFLETQYNLTITFINTSQADDTKSYDDILKATITSGIIPDLMDVDVLGTEQASYKKLRDVGALLNVYDFMQENATSYPNLHNNILSDTVVDDYFSDDGNLYCLPHYQAPDGLIYLVRGDWVEKAGYATEDITTLDIFRELMDVFVQEDFDTKKTDGFSTGAERYLYPFYAGYTGAYMFKNIDDYFTDWYTLYELREALGYLHLMYETHAFDNDYLLHDGAVSKTKITTGKAGAVATDIANLPLLESQLQKNIPDGFLEPVPLTLSGPGGFCRTTDKKHATANLISIYFEDPARIFDIYEMIFTSQGTDLVAHGVENAHYAYKNNVIVPNYMFYSREGWKYNEDGTTDRMQSYNEIRNIIARFEVVAAPVYSQNAINWYDALMRTEDIYTNPFEDNEFSDTKKIAALTAVKNKWVDDFISGKKPLSDKYWARFQKEYLDAGAQDQMDFYNSP